MRSDWLRVAQFGEDLLREHFAKLDTPLVEAEDIPDHALYEDLVLIHGHEAAKSTRSKLLKQY